MITIQELATYFERDGFHYDLQEDKHFLSSGFRGPKGNYRLIVQVASAGSRVMFLVREFDYVRTERRLAAMEALLQLNYELTWGGFAVDLQDGEVVFQVGVSTEDTDLSYELYTDIMGLINYVTLTYRDVLKMVVFGNLDPAAAIAACQAPQDITPIPPQNGTSAPQ